jgi:hypothetical protein
MTTYETILVSDRGPRRDADGEPPRQAQRDQRQVLDDLTRGARVARRRRASAAAVLTGAGDKAFVAGADIAAMAEMGAEQAAAFARKGHALGDAMAAAPFPIVAAVNGFALGGGTELALACDLIYASEKAKFGQPEVGLGVIPGFGGTQRLARRVGVGKARELVYVGADHRRRGGARHRPRRPGVRPTRCSPRPAPRPRRSRRTRRSPSPTPSARCHAGENVPLGGREGAGGHHPPSFLRRWLSTKVGVPVTPAVLARFAAASIVSLWSQRRRGARGLRDVEPEARGDDVEVGLGHRLRVQRDQLVVGLPEACVAALDERLLGEVRGRHRQLVHRQRHRRVLEAHPPSGRP